MMDLPDNIDLQFCLDQVGQDLIILFDIEALDRRVGSSNWKLPHHIVLINEVRGHL